MVSPVVDRHVDVDNVAVDQGTLVRDPVTNHLVDGRAAALRELKKRRKRKVRTNQGQRVIKLQYWLLETYLVVVEGRRVALSLHRLSLIHI